MKGRSSLKGNCLNKRPRGQTFCFRFLFSFVFGLVIYLPCVCVLKLILPLIGWIGVCDRGKSWFDWFGVVGNGVWCRVLFGGLEEMGVGFIE